ncbi:unnamed protein product [Dovyalis caffra]|uniref:Uncharacterized protein n=1 Tax=Dovyalis caffra TaxID=77055 RepID=A0AAV1RJB5_9ROSI|nr:unnamed protein product [Dovyalis caffra]
MAIGHRKISNLASTVNSGTPPKAEEVLASLAIPLIKLVGLRIVEMVNEGQFSGIIIDDDINHRNGAVSGGGRDRNVQISAFEGENFSARAAIAGEELIEKRKMQFTQLVILLRQIQTIKSSPSHIPHVITMLGSVRDGVEDLIQGLSQQMCNPMMEYVKGLKDDMKNGTCMRLVAMVDEMEKKNMKDVRVELEDARKKVRLAEEGKIEAVCKLNETIERVRKKKEQLSSLPEAKRGLIKSSFSQKVHSLDSSILYSRAFDLN